MKHPQSKDTGSVLRALIIAILIVLGLGMLTYTYAVGVERVTNKLGLMPTPEPTATPTPTATPEPLPPIVVPKEYVAIVRKAAALCPQVPKELLAAQITVESDWDEQAKSPAGAKGIAQFMKKTWDAYKVDGNKDGHISIWNPDDAIATAAVYDCELLKNVEDVPGNPLVNMLAAYNAGPTAVRQYQGVPPFPETQDYVDKVLSTHSRLEPF